MSKAIKPVKAWGFESRPGVLFREAYSSKRMARQYSCGEKLVRVEIRVIAPKKKAKK